jgi:hypothetical protein
MFNSTDNMTEKQIKKMQKAINKEIAKTRKMRLSITEPEFYQAMWYQAHLRAKGLIIACRLDASLATKLKWQPDSTIPSRDYERFKKSVLAQDEDGIARMLFEGNDRDVDAALLADIIKQAVEDFAENNDKDLRDIEPEEALAIIHQSLSKYNNASENQTVH